MTRHVAVGPIESASTGAGSRVSFPVDGTVVWFESPDLELAPSPEAAGSAVLLPATKHRRPLRIVGSPVAALWCENVVALMEVWREWWRYPVLAPDVETRSEVRSASSATALCFTGGLDSFYSLLRSARRPDALVFVQGFDIPLGDQRRLAAWDDAMTRVAAEVGARAVRIRSNLRDHPLLRRSQWDRAHGGALAAVGHLLTSVAGELVIASSAPTSYGYAWGSHERIDHLWSSDTLRVVHHGATESRVAKLRAIAGEPLVQQHLRVCWENRSPVGNCSACDKCVCTMVTIAAVADPSQFVSFDWSAPLERRLAAVRSTRFVMTYGELLQLPLPDGLSHAVRALLRRNVWPSRLRSLWHRLKG